MIGKLLRRLGWQGQAAAPHAPLTAEEVTRYYGERCFDFDRECRICQMWLMFDEVERLQGTEA